MSVIGSSSKNTSGQLYTLDIQFNIDSKMQRRNKRAFDVVFAILMLLIFPIHLVFQKNRLGFFKNSGQVIWGKKSWVSYAHHPDNKDLPNIKPGVLSPLDGLQLKNADSSTIHQINFIYSKDYEVNEDIEILVKSWRELGK